MDLPALLDDSMASTGAIVAGVRPDQLGDSTPCSEWDLRTLLNHLIGVCDTFSRVADGTPIAPPTPGREYFTGNDYAAAYDSAAAAANKTWRQPGILDSTITLPFGDFPGSAGASINFFDVLVHGWDVARATGQASTLDPRLAEPALEICRNFVSDDFRAAGAFGPEVAVPTNAPAGDRLVAFLGRTP